MVIGAFTGFLVGDFSGSLWLGILAAILAGAISGWLMSLMTVRIGVNQHVSGLGITLLLTAIASYGFRLVYGEPTTPPTINGFARLTILPENWLVSSITINTR
jgi:simple sugar transport system permease protein